MLNAALTVAETMATFSAWLHSPPPPPKKKVPPPLPAKIVPPFDIQDVPRAMRKLSMPISAKLQERWFAGEANYSLSARDLMNELDQNRATYVPGMVDSTSVKMSWVLSFRRARRAFDELIQKLSRTPSALDTLKTQLAPYRNSPSIFAWHVVDGNLLELHKKFQFQFAAVNASWGEQLGQFLERSLVAGGVPDDLTGALGSFNFYAAVRYAYFEPSPSIAVVTDISVYVHDAYEFSDDQYLGHWSPSHVAAVPTHLSGKSGWLAYPVREGNLHDKDGVLYPVTNKDYRDWRQQHGQGGDFMIYTDLLNMKLDVPIRVAL